jgi:hypothetical protein
VNTTERNTHGQGSVDEIKTNNTQDSLLSQNDTENEIIKHITQPEVVS